MNEEPGITRATSAQEEHPLAEEVPESSEAPVLAHSRTVPPFRNLVLLEPDGKVLCEGEGLKSFSAVGEGEDTLSSREGISNEVTITRPRSTPLFRSLVPREPLGRVLYRDEVIIRQIYDSVTAAINHTTNHVVQPRSGTTHDLHKQLASLEWEPRSDTNFDYLVLLLSSCVDDKETVTGLIQRIWKERENKSHQRFVYPAMPVRVRGIIQRKGDVSKKRIRLRDGKFSIHIILDEAHTLHQDPAFLMGRSLFVLGIVQDVGNEVIIKAGALLL